MATKRVSYSLLISIALAIIGSISVVGMLQSTERVSSSGIIVQPPPPAPDPPIYPPPYIPNPPEPTIDIEIYSNPQCTQEATNIEWGPIEVGGQVNREVYVKNIGDTTVILSFITQDWSPVGATDYIQLSWDYDGTNINPGTVKKVTLTLTIDTEISGIDTFEFDIVFIGEPF